MTWPWGTRRVTARRRRQREVEARDAEIRRVERQIEHDRRYPDHYESPLSLGYDPTIPGRF